MAEIGIVFASRSCGMYAAVSALNTSTLNAVTFFGRYLKVNVFVAPTAVFDLDFGAAASYETSGRHD